MEAFKDSLHTELSPPGLLICEDMAFGRPIFPTGRSSVMSNGEDSNHYHHLLQQPVQVAPRRRRRLDALVDTKPGTPRRRLQQGDTYPGHLVTLSPAAGSRNKPRSVALSGPPEPSPTVA
ncbi:hypothetical protein T261_8617 [Streptomyces lydicus]|nr:hypothetical protein T261_8617 [Streptomyces lydicus]